MADAIQPNTLWLLGCGPGIGMSVAARFAREGFALGLVTLDAGAIAQRVGALRERGTRADVLQGDLGDQPWLAECLASLESSLGLPDVLIYNASSGADGPASTLRTKDLLADMGTNLVAPLSAAQHVLPGMKKNTAGTIIFTGGGIALKPEPGKASGSIGKCALRQLALLLHNELKPDGVHVATVTVAGFVQKGGPLDPDGIAEHFWRLHIQSAKEWACEIVLTPSRVQ